MIGVRGYEEQQQRGTEFIFLSLSGLGNQIMKSV